MHDDFAYGDSDELFMEINDFYNYTEVPRCSEYQECFNANRPEGTCLAIVVLHLCKQRGFTKKSMDRMDFSISSRKEELCPTSFERP